MPMPVPTVPWMVPSPTVARMEFPDPVNPRTSIGRGHINNRGLLHDDRGMGYIDRRRRWCDVNRLRGWSGINRRRRNGLSLPCIPGDGHILTLGVHALDIG